MTVDCSVEGPGIKDTMHLGFVLNSDFNDFFWEMYNLCVWREVILNNWAFPLMIFNSCDEWPSSPQASPCTLQCAKDAAHWRDWWVSSNNISNILNIKKHFWKHFRVNILSKVHMMGLVLTLLYLIGGLGAVVWFVVSHKDEEEISVDERYLCIFICICICCPQRWRWDLRGREVVKSLHVEMIGKSESLEIWRKYSRCQDDAIVAEIGTKMPPPLPVHLKRMSSHSSPLHFSPFSILNVILLIWIFKYVLNSTLGPIKIIYFLELESHWKNRI